MTPPEQQFTEQPPLQSEQQQSYSYPARSTVQHHSPSSLPQQWHRHNKAQLVTVQSGNGWLIELQGKPPMQLLEGSTYIVAEWVRHRLVTNDASATELVLVVRFND